MTSIRFYGGVNEIGGNKILVEDRGTRVFLDFGKSFATWSRYFEEYLKPTPSRGIEQFWSTGLLPDIEGIYRPDLLAFAGAKVHKEPFAHAVLLSHAHFDHSAYISFLDNRIPVYCPPVTKAVLEAVQKVGTRDLETEVVDFKPRPLLRKDYRKPATKRDIKVVEKTTRIDSIEAEFLPVDHSIPGACGLLLHCSEGTIAYSGDLRLHGVQGDLTQEFAGTAALEKPQVFLCEGTRITSTENHGEPYVKANAIEAVKETKNLVIADFSWKDTTRFLTFYGIAKATGRKLLVPFRTAYYIQTLKQVIPELPSPKDEQLLLYQEKAGSGTYAEDDYIGEWRKDFLDYANSVRADYIHEQQSKIIACLGFFDLIDLIDIQPQVGSAYIHSMSEPHNEEQAFDKQRAENWLNLFNLSRYQIHASGHASQQDLFKVAQTVAPKKLVPIHTEYPKAFEETGLVIEVPEVGERIAL